MRITTLRMNTTPLPYVAPTPAPWLKDCSCCKRTYDLDSWKTLNFVGYQPDDELPVLELRNCSKCGSTLSRLLGDP